MEISGKTIVVTGAGGGIGRALAQRFAHDGAARVICADLDLDAAQHVAEGIGGVAMHCDVAQEAQIRALIEHTEAEIGSIDLFCSNAGVLETGGVECPDHVWSRSWDINVMSAVWAARHVVPRMIQRGGGYLLNTASAAGLLNMPGAAPYAVTKHAAVGLAEWLALTYGDQGIGVTVLCPQAVKSAMTQDNPGSVAEINGLLDPEDVAVICASAVTQNRFLALPHPEVADYLRAKSEDYDRWIMGMQRLNARFGGS